MRTCWKVVIVWRIRRAGVTAIHVSTIRYRTSASTISRTSCGLMWTDRATKENIRPTCETNKASFDDDYIILPNKCEVRFRIHTWGGTKRLKRHISGTGACIETLVHDARFLSYDTQASHKQLEKLNNQKWHTMISPFFSLINPDAVPPQTETLCIAYFSAELVLIF